MNDTRKLKVAKVATIATIAALIMTGSAQASWWSWSDDDTATSNGSGAQTMNGMPGGGQGGPGGGEMGMGGGMELPDDWDEMTDEEKETWMEENRPELPEGMEMGSGAQMRLESGSDAMGSGSGFTFTRSYTVNARKGQNYQGFSGELEEEVEFTDDSQIENSEAVKFLQQRGILKGYSDGSFKPANPISRAESTKVILEGVGMDLTDTTTSSFSDVAVTDWYFPYVQTAKEEGFISGYSDGTFRPNQTVGQAELLKIAFEIFGIDLSDYSATSLPDGLSTSEWYAPYLQYALDNNLLEESDVDLTGGMTREQFSDVIYKLIQQQEGLE